MVFEYNILSLNLKILKMNLKVIFHMKMQTQFSVGIFYLIGYHNYWKRIVYRLVNRRKYWLKIDDDIRKKGFYRGGKLLGGTIVQVMSQVFKPECWF